MLGAQTNEQLMALALEEAIALNQWCLKNGKFLDDPSLPVAEPEYDSFGKQVNTRQTQQEEHLRLEQTELVAQARKLVPNFTPPAGFKPVHKTSDKVFLPTRQYPEINFVGLLIGPRGKTLQKLQQDTNCRIALRGRGSSKNSTYEKEDLHVLLHGRPEALIAGTKAVNKLVNDILENPEGGDHKREQLRQLASLNGTLRDSNCSTCGSTEHQRRDCPDKPKFVCRVCGEEGHFARDCTQDSREKRQKLDRPRERESGPPGAPGAPPGAAPQAVPVYTSAPPGLDTPPGFDSFPSGAPALGAPGAPPELPAPAEPPAPPAPPAPAPPAPPAPPGPPSDLPPSPAPPAPPGPPLGAPPAPSGPPPPPGPPAP